MRSALGSPPTGICLGIVSLYQPVMRALARCNVPICYACVKIEIPIMSYRLLARIREGQVPYQCAPVYFQRNRICRSFVRTCIVVLSVMTQHCVGNRRLPLTDRFDVSDTVRVAGNRFTKNAKETIRNLRIYRPDLADYLASELEVAQFRISAFCTGCILATCSMQAVVYMEYRKALNVPLRRWKSGTQDGNPSALSEVKARLSQSTTHILEG